VAGVEDNGRGVGVGGGLLGQPGQAVEDGLPGGTLIVEQVDVVGGVAA
jgi:hypothetical protein